MRESAVMMSSTIPSAKYSCSGSPLIFWNGKTAIDGLSGSVRVGLTGVIGARPITDRARIGRSIFLSCLLADILELKI